MREVLHPNLVTDTSWQPDLAAAPGPKYRALADALARDVREGRLPAGARLPPVRDLAWALKVTPGTVARAYRIGTEAGLLEATVGRGTFVRGTAPQQDATPEAERRLLVHSPTPGLADLLVSQAVDVGQGGVISAHLAAIAGTGLDFTRYVSEISDLLQARRAACDWLAGFGLGPDPADLMLTEGALNGVFCALELALRGPSPVVIGDALSYPGFRRVVQGTRGRYLPVEGDAEGLLPEAVADACARQPVGAMIVTPNAQNPTAARMGAARREALAELARRHDLAVIEDDVYALAIGRQEPGFESLCPERTWVALSLSKCVAAGLRIGMLVCPPGRGPEAPRRLRGVGLSTSLLLATLLERLLVSGDADRIRAQVLGETEARRETALRLLAGARAASLPGLNFLWLELPPAWRLTAFVAAVERAGILIAGADIFAGPDQPAPNAVRIALSGPADRPALARSLERIAALLRAPEPDLVA
jgi:DNA-binding transcriptional MocR family regulator